MKLRMLTLGIGPDSRTNPGDTIDVTDDKEAKRLIREGYAEEAPPDAAPADPAKPATTPETADKPVAGETATKP